MAVCQTAGAAEIGDFRASSLSTLVQMVSSGLGLTLLPAMATETASGQGLTLLPFVKPVPKRTIGLVWRRASARAAEFELLAAALESG